MRPKTSFSPDSITFAPFVLVPSTFPHHEFMKVKSLQPAINKLIHRVAHDQKFLKESLMNTVKVDDFTGRLFQIYEAVHSEGISQRISLGLLRSDYFLHSSTGRVLQVEVNTIASSFAGIATQVSLYHRYILSELGAYEHLQYLPDNQALQSLVAGMLKAWEMYGCEQAVILFIVEDITYNICDQRFHEFQIQTQNPKVRVMRCTLTDVGQYGTLDKEKKLYVKGKEVAVIYFRAGYSPEHYHSSLEWDARLLMERSKAIKSPSIQYHLAGTKKVQQELARPNAVERFIENEEDAKAIRALFAGLYSLDMNEEGDESVKMAIKNPHAYILKPQREGGGNNIYGKDVRETLERIGKKKERTGYILMDRIVPPIQKNYIVRPGSAPELNDVISELGIFGTIIGDSEEIFWNQEAGHMLRTKLSTANEGGVAAGVGALDSPYLFS
ncbi:unnamed protein product [Darwinula stevensoni]|uniref:Glutathione synthetase n=1 Tax=Darwinula stevensoni TaxID=69355 RepID=A0A7R9A0D6_9CRUS|nr:unnamed protein product [Darwinula stevensoni]CAG0880834.1 unnamed protein product [Darwinula stevensoni]